MKEFAGKTALITGASEGIGRATALAFAEAGANLILIARNEERLKSLAEEVQAFEVQAQVIPMDLTQRGAITKVFSQIKDLDFVVNNAGTEGRIAPVVDLEEEDLEPVLDLNLRATYALLLAAVKLFKQLSKRGAIVNVASIAGLRPFAKSALYCASKYAVVGLTKSAALDAIKFGVRINSVCPGPTKTKMINRVIAAMGAKFDSSSPTTTLCEPSSVANSILFLCSDRSKDICGHDLVVNG